MLPHILLLILLTLPATGAQGPEPVNAGAPESSNPEPMNAEAPESSNPEPVNAEAPESSNPEPVSEDAPESSNPEPVSEDAPESSNPEPMNADDPESSNPEPVNADAPDTSNPEPVSEDAPESSNPEPVSEDAPESSNPEPVSEDSPDTSNPEPVSEDSPDTSNPEPVSEDSPDTSNPEPVSEDSPDTSNPEPVSEDASAPRMEANASQQEEEEEESGWGWNSLRSSFNSYFDSVWELLGGRNGKCQYRCKYGKAPLARRDYKAPEPNGCSSYFLGLPVPEGVDLGIPAMTKCCNQLDMCYDTCGANKYRCDSKFRWCLHGICSDLKKSLGFVSRVEACETVADTLFNTLWTLGCRPYMNSQRAACICDEEERDEL